MTLIKSSRELKAYLTSLDGSIVGVPKNTLTFNSELYIVKKYENDIVYSGYNKEDGTPNGFSFDSHIVSINRFVSDYYDCLTWYHFDNLAEFCGWYLNRKQEFDIIIDNFVKETNKVAQILDDYAESLDSKPSKNKRTRREVLADVIEYIRMKDIVSDCERSVRNYSVGCTDLSHDFLYKELEKYKNNLNKWLDEVVE